MVPLGIGMPHAAFAALLKRIDRLPTVGSAGLPRTQRRPHYTVYCNCASGVCRDKRGLCTAIAECLWLRSQLHIVYHKHIFLSLSPPLGCGTSSISRIPSSNPRGDCGIRCLLES